MIRIDTARSGAQYLACDACPDFQEWAGTDVQREANRKQWAAKHQHKPKEKR